MKKLRFTLIIALLFMFSCKKEFPEGKWIVYWEDQGGSHEAVAVSTLRKNGVAKLQVS